MGQRKQSIKKYMSKYSDVLEYKRGGVKTNFKKEYHTRLLYTKTAAPEWSTAQKLQNELDLLVEKKTKKSQIQIALRK